MRHRCALGCLKANGTPEYHDANWQCPKHPSYDPGRVARVSSAKEQLKAAVRQEPASSTTPPASAVPPPTGGGKASALTTLEVTSQIAQTARREGAQNKAEEEWLLDGEHCETLAEFGRNMAREGAHFLDDLLQAEKTEEGRVKDSIFEMNPFEKNMARGGFSQRLSTRIVKGMGAKTLKQGQDTVDSMAFIGMSFTMLVQLTSHVAKVMAQSPRLKKIREASKESGGWNLFGRERRKAPPVDAPKALPPSPAEAKT